MQKQLIVRFLSVILTVALAMPVAGMGHAACPMQMGMHTAAAMQMHMQKSDDCPLCHKHQGMQCAKCALCVAPASMALLSPLPGAFVQRIASRSFDALNTAMTGDMPLPEFPPPRA